MNIQRTYLILNDIINKHIRNTNSTKTKGEILHYLFTHNIFIYNPQEINNGKLTSVEIINYYKRVSSDIIETIDDILVLENIKCDVDSLREYITNFKITRNKEINRDLEGDQQDCPKGDLNRTQIDTPNNDIVSSAKDLTDEEIKEIEDTMNLTQELSKRLIPLLGVLSRSYKLYDFKHILINENTKYLIIQWLNDNKIEIKKYDIIVSTMSLIIDENNEIINDIREMYKIAPAPKYRELVEKHFIPTNDEKKQNAEIPTPVKLVDEMLNTIPVKFWTKPQKVFEPCCGKGNFVLGIFDKFYKGLEKLYPDEIERCHIIMTECIYYADLTSFNVFITSQIIKCHIQSYCGLDELDYKFNTYIGDTLKLNIKEYWNINSFNAICGNPPYNSSGNTGTGNTIWQDFTSNSLNKWLLPNGYLLFVHPPGWRKPNSERGKFTKMFDLMTKTNQMIYLEIHGIKDGQLVFKCGTRYDWYLIEKKNKYKNTIVIDEDKKQNNIDLSKLSWLPNSNILEINKILAKDIDIKCPIIYDRTAYGADKKDRVSEKKTEIFKYPCVHSTPKNGIRYMYSKVNDRGHFGISKVIFGESGIYKSIIDINGEFGMTHGAMGIEISNLEEGMNITKAIESDKFHKIIKSCNFSSFRIDWNIFKEFKKDFWKEFI
jgi:hypothetical protein